MAINRRDLLIFFGAAGLCAALPGFAASRNEWVIGACRVSDDQYGLTAIDLNGAIQWQCPLPSRGHDVALHETQAVGVAIARRPEQWLLLFDSLTGGTVQNLQMPDDIVLNGHAVWMADELFVTASDRHDSTLRLMRYRLKDGQLVWRDTTAFAQVGPHELVRYENLLHIAVGGLLTNGRKVLNKERFESGLLTLNAHTLAVVNYASSPASHVSLRHLSVNETGRVFISGQYQLDVQHSEPLLYALRGNELRVFDVDHTLWPKLKGYIGSIVAMGDVVVATSPRAHWMGSFSSHTLALQGQRLSHDICALAPSGSGIIAGTGTGKLWVGKQPIASHVVWDNHFQSRVV